MTDDEYRRRTPYQIEMEREARKLRTLREVIESTEARCVRIETRLTGVAIALEKLGIQATPPTPLAHRALTS